MLIIMKSLSQYILELASSRSSERDSLHDRSGQIIQHVILLINSPNDIDAKHWKSEVIAFLEQSVTKKLLNGNKRSVRLKLFKSVYFSEVLDNFEQDTLTRLIRTALMKHTSLRKEQLTVLTNTVYSNIHVKFRSVISDIAEAYADMDVERIEEILNDIK